MTCCIQAWEEGRDRRRGRESCARRPAAGQSGGKWGQGAKPLRGSARCKDASEPVLHISELWGAPHQQPEYTFCLTKVDVMLISSTCHPRGTASPLQAPSCSQPKCLVDVRRRIHLVIGKAARGGLLPVSVKSLALPPSRVPEGSAQPRRHRDASGREEVVASGMLLPRSSEIQDPVLMQP